MIGEFYTIAGIRVTLIPELEQSNCKGCVFYNPDHEERTVSCSIYYEVEELVCGKDNVIYFKVDVEKGHKKQLKL
jgi:hypothetical protein